MKLSKRLSALFAAILMTVTIFTSAIPTYAKSKDFTCGGATATGYVSSATTKTGSAWTKSNSGKSFSYLYAAVFGTRVDKNGDNPRYLSGSGKEGKGTNSGTDVLKAILNSTDYYARVVSANVGTYNGKTNSTPVTISR